MAYWDNVGPITWIVAGETHYWVYGWEDWRPEVMCIAGPDLDRYGSAGAIVWATEQGKRMRIDNGPFRHRISCRDSQRWSFNGPLQPAGRKLPMRLTVIVTKEGRIAGATAIGPSPESRVGHPRGLLPGPASVLSNLTCQTNSFRRPKLMLSRSGASSPS